MGWDTMIRPASELEMFHFSGLRGSLLKILKDENEQEKTISFNNQFLLKIFNKNFLIFYVFVAKEPFTTKIGCFMHDKKKDCLKHSLWETC